MSIVNESEQRIFLPPEPYTAAPIRSDQIRRRNRRWLDIKRRDDLTVRELAKKVGARISTVAAAVHWAQEDEQRKEDRVVERLQSPEACPITKLSEHDVIYLAATYTPDTELGSLPEFWAILDPLLDKILGPPPEEPPLSSTLVA